MTRSLFDPQKAAGAEPLNPAASVPAHLSVSQAVSLIKTTLEQRMPSPIKVVGEVSNFKKNHHWYFSLKDSDAVLHCVSWATSIRKARFTPKDGDQIVATGSVSHFAPQGKTQLYVTDVQPVGAGALEMKFRAMCEELRGLGYFDEARKKPLPIFPRRLAVITSATSAAVQDVINTAAQRCKAVGLVIVDVRVQGEGAADEITRAIRWADRHRVKLGVDAILVTRGGGSIEDLWAFNERIVADAVFNCHLPVVAAIGHESDTTIIELVADMRASTPTQAAMRLVPSSPELCAQLDHLSHRIGSLVLRSIERERHHLKVLCNDSVRILKARLQDQRSRLERMAARLEALQPAAVVARKRVDIRKCEEALHATFRRRLRALRERLTASDRHLHAVSPLNVLERGYSITTAEDGTVIRSPSQVEDGKRLQTRVVEGVIDSIVTGGKAPNRKHAKPKNRDQPPPSLFATDID